MVMFLRLSQDVLETGRMNCLRVGCGRWGEWRPRWVWDKYLRFCLNNFRFSMYSIHTGDNLQYMLQRAGNNLTISGFGHVYAATFPNLGVVWGKCGPFIFSFQTQITVGWWYLVIIDLKNYQQCFAQKPLWKSCSLPPNNAVLLNQPTSVANSMK